MIYRRYGTSYQSVDLDFDAKALNEIGFRRNRQESFPVEELEARWAKVGTVELTADAKGSVQTETEQLMLDRLQEQLEALVAELPEGHALIVENESGHDYPKVRQVMKNVIEGGENRLFFEYSMSPSLRVSTYRPL